MAKNMQTEKQIRGALGEQAAVDYLRRNGFLIVERNYRIGHSEVDIIAQRYDELHFVEVKTRKAGSMMSAESSINEQKVRALQRAASAYIAQHRSRFEPRFSLITVEVVGESVVNLQFVEDMI